MTHAVELTLGDLVVTGWDEVAITLDLLQPGSPWTLTLYRASSPVAWSAVREAASLYADVEVKIDGHPQLVGQIERIREGADRQGAPLILSGRDLSGAAMASDADPGVSFKGVTLEEALERLFSPLALNLVIGASASDAREVQAGARPGRRGTRRTRRRHHVDRYKVQVGTKVWAAADQLARRHGYLLYTAPAEGSVGVVLDKPQYSAPVEYALRRTANARGEFDGNILSGFRDLSGAEVPTDVTVYGHTSLMSSQDAQHRAVVTNDALLAHPRVARPVSPRPRYLHDPRARTPDVARQRARRVLARAMADLDVYEATVEGWACAGSLWAINAMCRVRDELTGLDEDRLVTRVQFNRSRARGTTTDLRLVPRDSIVLEPDET